MPAFDYPESDNRFRQWWQRRSPEVQARIRRLNPRLREGKAPRGWHPAQTLSHNRILFNVIGKREFIQKHGREAFNRLPKEALRRNGKRVWIDMWALYYVQEKAA